MTATPAPRDAPAATIRIGRLSGDGPHVVSASGHDLVVVRTAAGIRAFQGHCPHRGALLGEGEFDGETLVCRNHRWRFDAADGRRLGGPGCLVGYPATEIGGEIVIEIPVAETKAQPSATRRHLDTLPGPRGLPLFGNAFQLDIPRFHEVLEGWATEYGPVYRYRLGQSTMVVVSDPALVDEALRHRPERFSRMQAAKRVTEEMKIAGVFAAEGAAWRPQRRLSMEALSHRHLRDFYPTLAGVAGKLRAQRTPASRSTSSTC